jgi:hypothetical protein
VVPPQCDGFLLRLLPPRNDCRRLSCQHPAPPKTQPRSRTTAGYLGRCSEPYVSGRPYTCMGGRGSRAGAARVRTADWVLHYAYDCEYVSPLPTPHILRLLLLTQIGSYISTFSPSTPGHYGHLTPVYKSTSALTATAILSSAPRRFKRLAKAGNGTAFCMERTTSTRMLMRSTTSTLAPGRRRKRYAQREIRLMIRRARVR